MNISIEKQRKFFDFIFEDTFLFKLIYLLFSVCTITPLVGQYTRPYFKITLVYGFLILVYKTFVSKTILSGKYTPYILLFLGCILISTLVNFDKALIANIKTWCYSVIQFLLIASVDVNAERKRLCKEIFVLNNIAIAMISLTSFISFLFFLFRINGECTVYSGTNYETTLIYGVGYGNRLTGITLNPNMLGIVSLIGIAAIFINLFLHKTSIIIKVLYAICFLFNFSCFIMSGSRGAEIGGIAFFTILIFGYIIRFFKNKKYYVLKNIVALLVSLILVFGIFNLFEPFKKAIGYLPAQIAILQEESFSSDNEDLDSEEAKKELLDKYYVSLTREEDKELGNGRLTVWRAGVKTILKHPIFGVGNELVAEYVQSDSPDQILPGIEGGKMHNVVIQTQVAYGLVATIPMFILIFVLIKDFFIKVFGKKSSPGTDYTLLFTSLAAVALLFVNNMTETNILHSTSILNCFFMLYLGYLMYFLQIKETET